MIDALEAFIFLPSYCLQLRNYSWYRKAIGGVWYRAQYPEDIHETRHYFVWERLSERELNPSDNFYEVEDYVGRFGVPVSFYIGRDIIRNNDGSWKEIVILREKGFVRTCNVELAKALSGWLRFFEDRLKWLKGEE